MKNNESLLLEEKNYNKLIEKVKQYKNRNIIFTSNDDDLNRKVLEKISINILLLSLNEKKDFQKQRESGLNQVLTKIAKENKIKIGINIDEIIEEKNKKQKAKILARLKQNIRLCKKYKVQMKFISIKNLNNLEKTKDPYDLKSLGLVLGMPTWMVKNCV